jgi:CubicO group peptidase (beta-lactamase class C family)
MRKSCFLPIFAIVLCFGLQGYSQLIELHAPPNASVDYSRLARIDTLVKTYIDKGWLTGMVILIVKDNQLIQYKGYGYSDRENKKPMNSDALFRLASQTKAVVSVGIMTLYEEGKFYLDESIADS